MEKTSEWMSAKGRKRIKDELHGRKERVRKGMGEEIRKGTKD